MPKGYWDYAWMISKVITDKCWHSVRHPDMTSVDRIYPEISYYEYWSSLLASEPSKIMGNIYLGNAFNAADYYWLKDHRIQVIVNVTPEISNYFPDEFEYHHYPNILDTHHGTLKDYYDRFYNLVEQAQENERPILVHCFAGRSRSTSLVLYYLMKKYNWTSETALNYLREKRPVININKNFLEEIHRLFPEDVTEESMTSQDQALTQEKEMGEDAGDSVDDVVQWETEYTDKC